MLKQDRKASAKIMKSKEAKEKQIFFIEPYNEVYQKRFIGTNIIGERIWFHKESEGLGLTQIRQLSSELINCDYRIASSNLYDFVMQSAEETTSPRGAEMKLHIRHSDYPSPRFAAHLAVPAEEDTFEVWTWGASGRHPQLIESFDTEEEAVDFIFERIYQYDFLPDDQRNTCYFDSEEEAMSELIESYAARYNIDFTVAESYYKHSLKATELREKKELDERRKNAEISAKNQERINTIASEYAKLITKIEGESYKQTAARLSQVIGERIESAVFHAAVKIIRQ